ncbi:MAG: ORF6N domain-containing protein, partial [Chitinophagaceae bacterium]
SVQTLSTMAKQSIVAVEKIDRSILLIRKKRVMLDVDLARVFGTTTKRLNQTVRRNIERFPEDFMFQLTPKEKEQVVTNCDHLGKLKYSSTLPYAFTEHGTIMVATLLDTPIAIAASVQVVRAFVKLRELMIEHKDLSKRLDELENKYDDKFSEVFNAIRKLMEEPLPVKRPRIGYRRTNEVE